MCHVSYIIYITCDIISGVARGARGQEGGPPRAAKFVLQSLRDVSFKKGDQK